MARVNEELWGAWVWNPGGALGLALSLAIYFRGWRVMHRVLPSRFSYGRLVCFAAGLVALAVALFSPLEVLSGWSLSVHMIQHLLLMLVAPPLILLGAPWLPMLRGLPRGFAHDGLGPFLTWPPLQRLGQWLTHPVTTWSLWAVSLMVWHLPSAFELALKNDRWHAVEHLSFLGGSLLLWWPIVAPFPSRARWPGWALAIYLLAADVVNTILCAVLTFSDKLIYPSYGSAPRVLGVSALSDQVAAGVIMWVPGSVAFLVPATLMMIRYLSPDPSKLQPMRESVRPPDQARVRKVLSVATEHRGDLLAIRGLGPVIQSLTFRRLAQSLMLIVAVAVMWDGFFGSTKPAENAAGVLPWIHWRALTVTALLAAGNVFCFACPFMLVRDWGRRLGLGTHAWPRALRTKWIAVGLLVGFFWAYQAFDLWARPLATAVIILGYFVLAFAVDGWFRDASFCKYLCPIGQFHFVTSVMSPFQVRVREPQACLECRTHDCLRGNSSSRGCETQLFLPRKVGNLDCTFCLDCVRACPQNNVGLLNTMPSAELLQDPVRSGLGRLSMRTDLVVLALVLVAAGFVGAAAMTAPVAKMRDQLAAAAGWSSTAGLEAVGFLFGLVVVPVLMLSGVSWLGACATGLRSRWREIGGRLSLALVPLGSAMWAAHLGFHALAGPSSLGDLLRHHFPSAGSTSVSAPGLVHPLSALTMGALLNGQIWFLNAGLLITLYLGWRMALELAKDRTRAARLVGPWALAVVALYGLGVWVVLQPMEMRGVALQFL